MGAETRLGCCRPVVSLSLRINPTAEDVPVTLRYRQSRRFAYIRARICSTFLDRQHNQARNGLHTDAR